MLHTPQSFAASRRVRVLSPAGLHPPRVSLYGLELSDAGFIEVCSAEGLDSGEVFRAARELGDAPETTAEPAEPTPGQRITDALVCLLSQTEPAKQAEAARSVGRLLDEALDELRGEIPTDIDDLL